MATVLRGLQNIPAIGSLLWAYDSVHHSMQLETRAKKFRRFRR